MAAVRLSQVTKRYGDITVVRDVDLEIADGEFVVLVGPSGCGKSTLLRMIAGLDELSGGAIEIGGRHVEDVAPSARDVAMVFQSYALYPNMTVRQNVGFGLRLRGVEPVTLARRVSEVAQAVGLEDLLDRKPHQLSGGQRQRVAMARAIVRQPAVFLFDEPLSNLDAKLRLQVRGEIASLHRRLGTTTIYVTHDQVEAMTLAQKLVVLDKGTIQQVGAPMKLYREPANLFVAGFIGSPAMTFFDVEVAPQGTALAGRGFTLASPPGLALGAPGRPLVLGIRPESFLHVPSGDHVLDARVELVECLGSEVYVRARVEDQQLVARLPASTQLAIGDAVPLAVATADVHLFDRTTGSALPRT